MSDLMIIWSEIKKVAALPLRLRLFVQLSRWLFVRTDDCPGGQLSGQTIVGTDDCPDRRLSRRTISRMNHCPDGRLSGLKICLYEQDGSPLIFWLLSYPLREQ